MFNLRKDKVKRASLRRLLGRCLSGVSTLKLSLVFACCMSLPATAVAKEFSMPAAQPAQTYAAHDDHPTEKIAIAVEPYEGEDKASIFTVKYRNFGLLPIFFVVTNDGDEPVSLIGMKAQLNTKDRSKLLPETIADLQRRISRPKRNDRQNTLPIPLPKKEVKGGVDRKTMDELENAQFSARAVEPHSTARGFLFFDVSDVDNPLPGSSFYVVGVSDNKGNEVMYFEVPMDKYLNGAGNKKP